MGGIFICFQASKGNFSTIYKHEMLKLSKMIRHRGPDWGQVFSNNHLIMIYEHLSIVGIENNQQPIFSNNKELILTANGEIYNHLFVRKMLQSKTTFQTASDCESILHLYAVFGIDMFQYLDGDYAFALYDKRAGRLIVARDPMGVCSLYQGWSSAHPGQVFFASELKALQPICDDIIPFPPGQFYDSLGSPYTRFYQPYWWNPSLQPCAQADFATIRQFLIGAVRKRMMTDAPWGILLSGGFVSSLIASIAAGEHKRLLSKDSSIGIKLGSKIRTFSIGLRGSPDQEAAERVAKFLGTEHHSFIYTVEEGLDALNDTIYHLETYDITTVRDAIPMYLLCRKIKAMNIKMVFSGDGYDEIFGIHRCSQTIPVPDDVYQAHSESIQDLKQLHLFNCLRAHKCGMAWGIEHRFPFLDREFLDVIMSLDITQRITPSTNVKHHLLRKAFDVHSEEYGRTYLPDNILWRPPQKIGDGVGERWIDALQRESSKQINDEIMKCCMRGRWSWDKSESKESYYYKMIFADHFKPSCDSTVGAHDEDES